MADTCRHCGKPIARCEEFSPHAGCGSGWGWIHLEPDWGHHCPGARNKPYERQYARPVTE